MSTVATPTCTLTPAEFQVGAFIGCQRVIRARLRNAKPRYERTPWDADVEGACGEMAVAKWLDRFWSDSPKPDHTRGDVGRYQVRTCRNVEGGLKVYSDDLGDMPYILAAGLAPSFLLAGWLFGHEAHRADWWTESLRVPCFVAPQPALHPLWTLPTDDEGVIA